jgi:tetratricopeptide (TPR) repeat protein
MGMGMQPFDTQNMPSPSKQNLTSALNAYKRNDFLRASLLLYDIIKDKETAADPIDEQAEYTLGKTFYRLNLYQASLEFFVRVVKAGRQHRYYKATCKWLYYLSRKIPGDDILLEKIASYRPEECMEFQSEVSFLRGQHFYKLGQLEDALNDLGRVSRDNVLYLKATFLKGVTYSRLNNIKEALKSFAQILRYAVDSYNGINNAADAAFAQMQRAQGGGEQEQMSTSRLIETISQGDYKRDVKYFSQLAVLNMARLLYEQNSNLKAVRYYDYIPIEGFFWLEALFESSWALFRMGEQHHEKALGRLHTLSSPFFAEEYTPEAPILRAVILYSRCEYDKSLEAVASFREVYEPLLNELNGYVEDFSDPKQLYDFLRRIQADPSSAKRVSQILNALFEDRELKRINAHISELEREINVIKRARSSWATSDLANYVLQTIQFTRDTSFDRAGEMAKRRLERVVDELRDLRSKADAIDIEIATAGRSDTELSLSGVEVQRTLEAERKKRTPDAEHVYWPFEGEYWRDELGYYLYSIKSKCGR